ncbi:trypsin-like peptidase domain-containing protein [Micromonospora aurantiaca (nom. illeg.)]|uniref:trypsin-like peptidase domain-containing protein n=1 Tax=Micromonospora aurantiaca (nom. illeg.) TaxID=47850 RepID=UPI00160CC93E
MGVSLQARLVEVIADFGKTAAPRYRYGSGCIVAGRTVLTAAHVVAGAAAVRVRTPGKRLRKAMIDHRFVGDTDGPRPDLALIEIVDPSVDLPPLPLARLDRDGAFEASVPCHAYGYPWFAKRQSPVVVRELVDTVGIVPVLAKLVGGLLSVLVQWAPRPLPPEERTLTDSAWSGMSGGPVIADGCLLGVVIEHAPREGQSTITAVPVRAVERDPAHPLWGPGVEHPAAWWARLGVTGVADLAALPGGRVGNAETVPAELPVPPDHHEVALSRDVVDRYRTAFDTAGVTPPARWTAAGLCAVVTGPQPSRLSDLVPALRHAVEAKPILLDIGGGTLGLGRMQAIYRREVGAWPTGASVDALLVEAAEADRCERRRAVVGNLAALARFVIGVAAALGVPPSECPALAGWVESLGHQPADAEEHYTERHSSPAWLLIDLGGEPLPGPGGAPSPGTPPWPSRITWTYTTRHATTISELTGELTAVTTKEGLVEALKNVFATVPPAWPLLVDLAMPAGLLGEGIEHWPLFDVGDDRESLSDRHQPRLRWSQRRQVPALHGRCVERVSRASWAKVPGLLADAMLADQTRLKRWARDDKAHAWLIGRHPAAGGSDPLRLLLREGYGFLVWFRRGGDTRQRRSITRRVSQIPVAARRAVIPDELPDLTDLPVVVWDDPRGRAEFDLPPPVAAEQMSLEQL